MNENSKITPIDIASIQNIQLIYVCKIEPERDCNDSIHEYSFSTDIQVRTDFQFHAYGKDSFCRFTIPFTYHGKAGVYFLFDNNSLCYIGECENLESRFNEGYGTIFLKNCLSGGQQTNCRINHLILMSCKEGNQIDLYFHETANKKEIEKRLISIYTPPWNKGSKYPSYENDYQKGKYPDRNSRPLRNTGQYSNLTKFFNNLNKREISLTFPEIDQIVGGLPPSAYHHRAWWGNDRSHSHARAWLEAGYRVISVKLGDSVRFSRQI
jgi:hypothetical protein